MTNRELWQALGYRVEKRSLGVCGEGYVLLLPDGSYGPGCGEGRGWGNEPAAWAQLPSADTWEGMGRVIEAMRNRGWTLTLQSNLEGDFAEPYAAEFESAFAPSEHAEAAEAFGAVRLAAIRALGVSGE